MSISTDLTATLATLATAISNYAVALANDALNPQPTYKIDDKYVERDEWRTSLAQTITNLNAQILAIQQTLNALAPYQISTKIVI